VLKLSKIYLKIIKKSQTFKLLLKLIDNQQSAATKKVPPGALGPQAPPFGTPL